MYTQEEQIIDLRRALKKCYRAMTLSVEDIDHEDIREDFHDAMVEAGELLED